MSGKFREAGRMLEVATLNANLRYRFDQSGACAPLDCVRGVDFDVSGG